MTTPDPTKLARLGLRPADLGAPITAAHAPVAQAFAETPSTPRDHIHRLLLGDLGDTVAVDGSGDLLVELDRLLAVEPPEALHPAEDDIAHVRGDALLHVRTDHGERLLSWSSGRPAVVWPCQPRPGDDRSIHLPDLQLPTVPPVTSAVTGAAVEPALATWIEQNGSAPSPLDRLAAAGQIIRYWQPVRSEDRRAALNAILAGGSQPPVVGVRTWAATLPPHALDTLELHAAARARTWLLADLDVAALTAVTDDREQLAGVLTALGALGRGQALAEAVRELDALAAPQRAIAQIWSSVPSQVAAWSRAFDPDAWWLPG